LSGLAVRDPVGFQLHVAFGSQLRSTKLAYVVDAHAIRKKVGNKELIGEAKQTYAKYA
jgi:hypothetical protein